MGLIYIGLLIWIIYSIIEGKREGIFWHHRIKSSNYQEFKSIDRHPLFVIQRGLVLLLMAIISYIINDSFWLSSYLLLMNTLIFSFFHNGAMYRERNEMSRIVFPKEEIKWVYSKRWWDQSVTSTAKLTKFMSPISRTIQVCTGVIGYIIYLFL